MSPDDAYFAARDNLRAELRAEVTRILRENGIDEQEREHLRAHAAKSGKYVQAFDAVLRLIEEREGA